jgi:septum site-determining protein MinD
VGALAEVIGITAGKGGMGKTALTAAIAWDLACSGNRVLCIDCQDGMGDLDAYLGLGQLPDLTYAEVCRGLYPLNRATPCLDHKNLHFLAAPSRDAQVTETEFENLLRTARKEFDYILLDDPKFSFADRWILVTHANPAAIRGARRKADSLELEGKQNIRLIVNCIDPKQMQALGLTVDDVMDEVGLPLLGIVPLDPGVTLSCAAGKPLQSRKGAGNATERIASRIQGIYTAIPSRL